VAADEADAAEVVLFDVLAPPAADEAADVVAALVVLAAELVVAAADVVAAALLLLLELVVPTVAVGVPPQAARIPAIVATLAPAPARRRKSRRFRPARSHCSPSCCRSFC
jgi:hypothetical protein